MKKFIFIAAIAASFSVQAQTNRTFELRSCTSSEFTLAVAENIDRKKSDAVNFEIGKRVGYIIAEYYQKAMWALDDPETEGRAIIAWALASSQERIKHVTIEQLKREVNRCRKSFN